MFAVDDAFPFEAPADWPPLLPEAFYVGLDELNRRAYFACHETLEALWIPERRTIRELYQGVLQIAVGCYHLTERTNWVGAVNKLEAGARRLERTRVGLSYGEPQERFGIYGVDWRGLIQATDRLQVHLRERGRENLPAFERALLPHADFRIRSEET